MTTAPDLDALEAYVKSASWAYSVHSAITDDVLALIAHARELRTRLAAEERNVDDARAENARLVAENAELRDIPGDADAWMQCVRERGEARARVAELESNIDASDGCKACAFSPPDLRMHNELAAARAVVEAARKAWDSAMRYRPAYETRTGEIDHGVVNDLGGRLAAYDAAIAAKGAT